MTRLLLFFLALLSTQGGLAQELNCLVKINSQNVESADRRIFDDMEQAFSDFINDRNWTQDEFLVEERIKANLIITLLNTSDPAVGNWQATVQVQVARPIYNTNYESLLLNFADRDWNFEYVQSQPLNFNLNNFTDNISSLLAFYAYIILAMDYDSFAELGGDEHIQNAWTIVNNAQNSGNIGWGQFDSNTRFNRYWLAQNLLSPQVQELRKAWYAYHRLGLDTFLQDPDAARVEMKKLIDTAFDLNRVLPNSVIVRSFVDTKIDEVVASFSEGSPQLRQEIFDKMTRIAPSERGRLQGILN